MVEREAWYASPLGHRPSLNFFDIGREVDGRCAGDGTADAESIDRRSPLPEEPDAGWIDFDVGLAVAAWHARGEPNHGLVVMMSDDSHNQAHHWVYMTEQADPVDQPSLRIGYEREP